MRNRVDKIVSTLQAAWAFLATETPVFAHGIDERPGPGRNITIILSIVWIIIALGIVFFVQRLIRRDSKKHKRSGRGRENITKEF